MILTIKILNTNSLVKEVHNNLHDIYLYFEGFVYEKVNNFTIYLENKLFIENEPNQINIVLFEIFDKSYNRTFTKDNTIQKVVINKLKVEDSYPKRIVCLTEECVETLYLLGEQERIVGISNYAVRPKNVRKDKKVICSFINANIEKYFLLSQTL